MGVRGRPSRASGRGGAHAAVVRVHADADGLSYRTLLRRRGARWEDIAE
ncbi:PH domain-containing protein [Streptomyces albogriseolus]